MEAPAIPPPTTMASKSTAAAQLLDLGIGETARQVMVEQAHRLHERLHGGGADERPASLLQVLAEGGRARALETPDVARERSGLGLQLQAAARVVDGGLDLGP